MGEEILFYFDSTAPLSLVAKMFLDREQIPYVPLDVQEKPEIMEDVRSLEYDQLPVFVLADGRSWQGFDEEQMTELRV